MSMCLNPRVARATTSAEPRTQTIALSSVFAMGALLLNVSTLLGIAGCLALLLALISAFAAGHAITRWQPWPARYAFLLSAIGWLLTLVAWHSPHGWQALLPGIVAGALGLGSVWQDNGVERRALSMMEKSIMAISIVVAVTATLLTNHYADSGRDGFGYALTVLVDLALLGALVVRIREQDEKRE
jgi:hypothetical protein